MRRKLFLPLLALLLAAAGLAQLGLGTTAAGAVGAITDSSWFLSNQKQGGTSVKWAFGFKPTTTGTVKSITFEVLNATGAVANFAGGNPTVAGRSGINTGTATHTANTNKITYTVTTAASILNTTRVNLAFSGITNPAAKGNYTVRITTKGTTAANIDQGSTPAQFISTAVCVTSESPAQPGASAALKATCLFGPAAIGSTVTLTDYTHAVWQNGAGRKLEATWSGATPGVTKTVTISQTAPVLGAALSSADVNHDIEQITSTGTPGIDGIPAGDFITSVSGSTATLAYAVTTSASSGGGDDVIISNSTNRVSQNDGILNATTNCRGASLGDANLYACSASANFTASDVGKRISGDAIPDGDTIATFVSATKVKLTNGVPGTPSVTGTVTNADFTIEAATVGTSTRSVFDAKYSAGSDTCSATAKFAAGDVGLPVQMRGAATGLASGTVITATGTGATNPNGTLCAATDTWATVSPAPTGSSASITGCGIAAVCPEIIVGVPLATATANNDVVGSLGITLAVNPVLSPGSPPCSANHPSGFQLPLLWQNPGSMALGIAGTSDFTGSAVNKTYTGQFLVRTYTINFAGFLVQTATGWQVVFPSQPVSLGVCSGTNLGASYAFSGLSQSIVDRVNTANGSVGPPGTGQVRGIKPPTCTTGATSTGAADPSPAYSMCKNTPAAGTSGTATIVTNKTLDEPTVISACAIPNPAGFRWVQPTTGATPANTGFPCGNG